MIAGVTDTPALTHILGVVNVTDDSFSDGGQFIKQSDAVAHGLALASAGADIIDVGGQSTRPGATSIRQKIEMQRVIPVIKELASHGINVSVDTMRAEVAAAAVEAGANMVNDVSGGRADPEMAPLMASLGLPWILMHWRSKDFIHTSSAKNYGDVVADVSRELMESVEVALKAGVSQDKLILDPGLGFAKTARHNWLLLQAIPDLQELGYPILIGASRKRFLGSLLTDLKGVERPADGRETATAVITALGALHEVWGVRVHDVTASMDALKVVRAWETGGVETIEEDEEEGREHLPEQQTEPEPTPAAEIAQDEVTMEVTVRTARPEPSKTAGGKWRREVAQRGTKGGTK
ncbi:MULTISPECIES: dihydropteroate synthase [Mycobacteroides]|uniref:Dihydropteroate synthase n=1 Tax=Mycobacteroides chelonae TaxID=1774 RepID=A0AB73N6Z2_MYCCH|nr:MULTISPECIES: dihydropteroate synthase [Mycobacteroides]AMW18251.1 dihydropteroate synthase [Mycobacterium sp. QIA-37]AYM40623.1 dihydropteroate synthase [[Mycobacterium] chelonae subsp. gwanakae]KRQ21186.1 dihydropteroate synthase [Mycobacteroides sp. H072]KRQ39061.1 dihydropteroate synthase [Mycobacteroides sp. H002]KRQ54336.1 dihydropteroate synthase [Mycobacteroides sp. H054]